MDNSTTTIHDDDYNNNNNTSTKPNDEIILDEEEENDDTATIHLIDDGPLFYKQLHIEFICKLIKRLEVQTSYEGAVTEHLKVSGVYWTLMAYTILQNNDTIINTTMKVQTSIIDWIFTCYDSNTGGFGGNTNHNGHILYTLSSLQILAVAHKLNDKRLQCKKQHIIQFISSLQNDDGSFCGDSSSGGEIDTRFTYCAVSSLAILQSLNNDTINVDNAAQYILQCHNNNYDCGFGSCIGAESHAGQIFTCIGSLSILQRLHLLCTNTNNTTTVNNNNIDTNCNVLGWWLCERQCDSGGLNGRPEKQADVCYSWWIVSTLCIINKLSWISIHKLGIFILKCQDTIDGGIADRPDDMPDIFHTFFGIAGLSLLGYLVPPPSSLQDNSVTTNTTTTGTTTSSSTSTFRTVDPIYALPTEIVQELKLPGQVLLSKSSGETLDPRLSMYSVVYID